MSIKKIYGNKGYVSCLLLTKRNEFNGQSFDVQQLLHIVFNNRTKIIAREICPSCHKKDELYQLERIIKLPKILIISLLRANKTSSTLIDDYVSYPDCLDLADAIDPQLFDGSSTRFQLVGVHCHVGNIHSGHYYSYAKVNGKWFCFDDANVTERGPNLNSRDVFTLFYQKI